MRAVTNNRNTLILLLPTEDMLNKLYLLTDKEGNTAIAIVKETDYIKTIGPPSYEVNIESKHIFKILSSNGFRYIKPGTSVRLITNNWTVEELKDNDNDNIR